MKNKKKYIVAVDIGGTKINIGYFNNNKLIKVTRFPTKKYGPDNIDTISQTLINSKINISAICLSLTGLINNKGLWNPINKKTLGDFKNYPVIKVLKNSLWVCLYSFKLFSEINIDPGEIFFIKVADCPEIKTREDWKSNESAQTTVKLENLLDEIKKKKKNN